MNANQRNVENRREHFRNVKSAYGIVIGILAVMGIFSMISSLTANPAKPGAAAAYAIGFGAAIALLVVLCRKVCSDVVDISFTGDKCRIETGNAFFDIDVKDVRLIRIKKGFFTKKPIRIFLYAPVDGKERIFRSNKIAPTFTFIRLSPYAFHSREREGSADILDIDVLKSNFTSTTFVE